MKNHKNCFTLLFCIVFSLYVFGQEFTPIVKQFAKKDYNASNQNWSAGQTHDGIMYFGNNEGLLSFDGSVWETYLLPQHKIARSIMIDKHDRIFVGSFEEFGYFQKNKFGQLIYTSLSAQLKNYEMKNDEIWNIINVNGTIVFQTFTSYFTFDGQQVEGFRCPYTFLFFSTFRNQIYTHTNQLGLSTLKIKSTVVVPVANGSFKSPIVNILAFNKKYSLIVTSNDGLFLFDGQSIIPFHTDVDPSLKSTLR